MSGEGLDEEGTDGHGVCENRPDRKATLRFGIPVKSPFPLHTADV